MVFGHNDVQFVRRPPNKAYDPHYTLPTVKHGGGSIQVWGCMSSSGVGRIHLVDGLMDSQQYVNILKKNLRPSVLKLGLGRRYTFQQDNDPKHTSKLTKKWFHQSKVQPMLWPSQSPGLFLMSHRVHLYRS